jgi:D-glycero-alpha-D-manno-heptose 1-phosphate guanylyltransferase
MEAIILAGGLGTRLRQEVPDLPKPMAPIAGKPFLECLLVNLAAKGFTKIIISVGYLSNKISDYFGDNYSGLALVYVVEQYPLGTGGAIRKALQHCTEEYVFVFNGDTYIDLDIAKIKQLLLNIDSPIVVVRQVPDTDRYGRIEVNDEGCISSFSEKGISGIGLINAGCYVLPRNALNDFPEDKPFSLELEYLKKNVNTQKISAFVSQGYFIDIGIPEDYMSAQTELPKVFNWQ